MLRGMHLVFHAGPLTEFMLLIPLLRAMDPPLTVVAPWQRAALAAHLASARPMDIELFEFTRLHAQDGPSRVSPAVGELFESAQRIVSFLTSEEDAWARNVRRLAPDAELLLMDPRPDTESKRHFTDWHRKKLAEAGLELHPVDPPLLQNPDGPIVVHPGGSAIKRCWPIERYEQLIVALREKGLKVRPVFGEVELERWSADRINRWTEQLQAEAFRTAESMVPVLQQARLFIGNDAGPMYIAAQLGTPTLAVLGPTDPAKTAPRGPHVRYIGPPNGPGRIEDVDLQPVIDAAAGV